MTGESCKHAGVTGLRKFHEENVNLKELNTDSGKNRSVSALRFKTSKIVKGENHIRCKLGRGVGDEMGCHMQTG